MDASSLLMTWGSFKKELRDLCSDLKPAHRRPMATSAANFLAVLMSISYSQTSWGQVGTFYQTSNNSSQYCDPGCVHGVCQQVVNSAALYCNCRGTGYTGVACNVSESLSGINFSAGPSPLADSPCSPACQHGGICKQDINSAAYYCECSRTGYKGASCAAPDLNASPPTMSTSSCVPACQHGGTCRQEVNSAAYYCDCSGTGFSGAACSGQSTGPTYSSAMPPSSILCSPGCQNGGICRQGTNSAAYFCDCTNTGFKGATCSAQARDKSPAVNSSRNISACSPACQHGTTCKQAVNSGVFYCDCEGTAFTGQDCSMLRR